MADWQQVKTAYLSGELSVASLCLKFEISKTHLYKKVNEEGWPKRRASNSDKVGNKKKSSKAKLEQAEGNKNLLDQMMGMIEKHLQKLDRLLGDDDRDSSADARHLTALAQAYRQLDSLKRQEKGDRGQKTCSIEKPGQGDEDAEAFRARLETRLAKFDKDAKG